jgi:hypothetical protein
MNLFEDLKQRVTLLNSQLRRVEHAPRSETRKILHTHLWRIVEELNGRLHLGLDNTALDLYVDESHLVIHYFEGSANNEVFIRIDPSMSVERQPKNNSRASAIVDLEKTVVDAGTAKDRFTIPGWRSSDLPVGIESQTDGWCDETPPEPNSPAVEKPRRSS